MCGSAGLGICLLLLDFLGSAWSRAGCITQSLEVTSSAVSVVKLAGAVGTRLQTDAALGSHGRDGIVFEKQHEVTFSVPFGWDVSAGCSLP